MDKYSKEVSNNISNEIKDLGRDIFLHERRVLQEKIDRLDKILSEQYGVVHKKRLFTKHEQTIKNEQ